VLSDTTYSMKQFSTREAARKLGVTLVTVQRHIAKKTLPAPPLIKMGSASVRLWTARDIERARKVLSGIRPGRKKQEA